LLEEQKVDLTQLLSRIDKISTAIDSCFFVYVENLDGPVADVGLDEKVHNFIRRQFDRPDVSVVAPVQSPFLMESIWSIETRLAVPVEP
jgi:hypothetical protein